MKLRATLLALTLFASPSFAVTLAQVRTACDSYIDGIEANARTQIQTCLATQDSCQTAWSCLTPCNNTSAAGSVCTTAQVDSGFQTAIYNEVAGTCSVSPLGYGTFSSRGITLPANAVVCFRLDVYSGPGGKGGALRYRAQYAGTFYEKARGFGPQASLFTYDWRTVTP